MRGVKSHPLVYTRIALDGSFTPAIAHHFDLCAPVAAIIQRTGSGLTPAAPPPPSEAYDKFSCFASLALRVFLIITGLCLLVTLPAAAQEIVLQERFDDPDHPEFATIRY
jgi:hypothetical protein